MCNCQTKVFFRVHSRYFSMITMVLQEASVYVRRKSNHWTKNFSGMVCKYCEISDIYHLTIPRMLREKWSWKWNCQPWKVLGNEVYCQRKATWPKRGWFAKCSTSLGSFWSCKEDNENKEWHSWVCGHRSNIQACISNRQISLRNKSVLRMWIRM